MKTKLIALTDAINAGWGLDMLWVTFFGGISSVMIFILVAAVALPQ